MRSLAVAVLVLSLFTSRGYAMGMKKKAPTQRHISEMKEKITEQLQLSIFPDPSNVRGFSHSLSADYVRLAFHTCPGRCNGCFNVNQRANRGLATPAQVLWDLYADTPGVTSDVKYNKPMHYLSFADFIALAGITSLEFTAKFQCPYTTPPQTGPDNCVHDKPEITFRYGRSDCTKPPMGETSKRDFPSNSGDYDTTMTYFKKFFGFKANEDNLIVALLGAHTLGFCSQQHSGYLGAWVSDVTRLDNNYYQVMRNVAFGWQENNRSSIARNPAFQWNPTKTDINLQQLMMLTADIALLLDVKVNPNTGESSCKTFDECGFSKGQQFVNQYADDNALWMKDFGTAFQRMIDNGYSPWDLKLPL